MPKITSGIIEARFAALKAPLMPDLKASLAAFNRRTDGLAGDFGGVGGVGGDFLPIPLARSSAPAGSNSLGRFMWVASAQACLLSGFGFAPPSINSNFVIGRSSLVFGLSTPCVGSGFPNFLASTRAGWSGGNGLTVSLAEVMLFARTLPWLSTL